MTEVVTVYEEVTEVLSVQDVIHVVTIYDTEIETVTVHEVEGVVTVYEKEIEVVSVGDPGLPGLQGPVGPTGLTGPTGPAGPSSAVENAILLTAAQALSANRAVTYAGSYADNEDAATFAKVAGVTSAAASTGEQVSVVTAGELDGFVSMSPGQSLYLSASGTLVQTVPAPGYFQKLGVALTATRALIRIAEPIVRYA